jgi:hypothetical protein|tara:strand:+ start:2158 stop:2331 length:174 start_codon:yes stop_codon:yes gene_type:complete
MKAILKETIHSTWWSADPGQEITGEVINDGSHFRYRYDLQQGYVDIPTELIEIQEEL